MSGDGMPLSTARRIESEVDRMREGTPRISGGRLAVDLGEWMHDERGLFCVLLAIVLALNWFFFFGVFPMFEDYLDQWDVRFPGELPLSTRLLMRWMTIPHRAIFWTVFHGVLFGLAMRWLMRGGRVKRWHLIALATGIALVLAFHGFALIGGGLKVTSVVM